MKGEKESQGLNGEREMEETETKRQAEPGIQLGYGITRARLARSLPSTSNFASNQTKYATGKPEHPFSVLKAIAAQGIGTYANLCPRCGTAGLLVCAWENSDRDWLLQVDYRTGEAQFLLPSCSSIIHIHIYMPQYTYIHIHIYIYIYIYICPH